MYHVHLYSSARWKYRPIFFKVKSENMEMPGFLAGGSSENGI